MRVLAQRSRTQCKRNATPHLKIRSCVALTLRALACDQNPHYICVYVRTAVLRQKCENGSAAPEMCCVCCGVRGLARVRVQRSCNVCNQYARMYPSKVRQKIFPIGEAHAQCILRSEMRLPL